MLEASKDQAIEIYNEQIKESRQTTSAVRATGQANRCRRKTRVYTKYDNPRKTGEKTPKYKERRKGHMKDALALGGDEGRDKLR